MPTQKVRRDSNLLVYAFLAQSVEHAAVNRGVVGSSPTRGARKELALTILWGLNFKYGPLAQLVRAAGS